MDFQHCEYTKNPLNHTVKWINDTACEIYLNKTTPVLSENECSYGFGGW